MARPKIPLIDKRRVVEIALDIIDTEGLDALSIRTIAARIGVNGASLYNHFANKDEILRAVAHLIISDVPARERTNQSYEDFVLDAMGVYRRMLLRHPNALPFMLQLDPRVLAPRSYEHGDEVMQRHGVPPEVGLAVSQATEALMIGSVVRTINWSTAGVQGDAAATDSDADGDERRFRLAAHTVVHGLLDKWMSDAPGPQVGRPRRPTESHTSRPRSSSSGPSAPSTRAR